MTREEIELRPAVKWFAEQMELTLRKNDHKGGWKNESMSWLFMRLKQEEYELDKEIVEVDADYKKLISEATDVANFAMMIADQAKSALLSVMEGEEEGE